MARMGELAIRARPNVETNALISMYSTELRFKYDYFTAEFRRAEYISVNLVFTLKYVQEQSFAKRPWKDCVQNVE